MSNRATALIARKRRVDWPVKSLESFLAFLTSGSRGWAAHYADSGDLFLRIQNVGRNRLILDDVAFVRAPDTAEARRTSVQPGDVLLSITADLGRTAVIPEGLGKAFINQHLAILRVKGIDSNYLSAYLTSPSGQAQFSKLNREGVKAGLNFDDIRSVEIPLPPLDEQRRIAAILDAADSLRAKRRAALAKLDQLAQSIFIEMFGDPNSNASSANSIPLGDIARFIGGGTPSRAVPAYFEGDICWATSKDMKNDLLWDTQEHVTEKAIDESATNLVEPGTILVVVKSKILMRRLPVAIAMVPVCFGQDLKGIQTQPGWPIRYIAQHLRIGQNSLLRLARGANTEGLTLDHLRNFRIFSATEEQRELFERADEQVERQRALLRDSLAQLERLFISLQHRAFRGEL